MKQVLARSITDRLPDYRRTSQAIPGAAAVVASVGAWMAMVPGSAEATVHTSKIPFKTKTKQIRFVFVR